MRVIADLHLHSKWSRACSKDLTLSNIARACEKKGINLVGTSDAFHPVWRMDIGQQLQKICPGTFILADGSSPTRFILTTEISCIYKRFDKVRRVHHVLLFSGLAGLDNMAAALEKRGCNLKSDGRPIVGIDSEELLKMLLESDPRSLLIPAHAWTPWFSIFGSQSGFDSLEECFGGLVDEIHAIETGLSSDPAMNWRLSRLDRVFLVSNSDAHSLDNLGREANVFEMPKPSYAELYEVLTRHQTEKFLETIEFFPEEGKYYADGHRACRFWCEPEETKKLKGICPRCGKLLTVGVLHRISDLADRAPHPPRPSAAASFRSIVPLREILAAVVGFSPKSKRVQHEYDPLIKEGRNEFSVLLDLDSEELSKYSSPEIVQAILAVRQGGVDVIPGFDGQFGTIKPRLNYKKIQQLGIF